VTVGINSGIYKFLLVLHILSAIVGFGSVILNGIYGQQAKTKKGPEGLAIMHANFLVARIAEFFIYAVFIFGFLLVLVSDDVWSFGDTWIWASMLLFVFALGLSHGLLIPNVRKMIGLMEQLVAMGPPPAGATATAPPTQVVEMEERGRVVGMTSTVLDLMLVVILALMVWKP
jgi:uncharacterized membrane protein